jgi:hypothetical protein
MTKRSTTMSYKFRPIDQQLDLGFGVTAESFKHAADQLSILPSEIVDMNRTLPIGFLYRHSIELFLKSLIVLIHRVYKVPFMYEGKHAEISIIVEVSEPLIPENVKCKRIAAIHEIDVLLIYLLSLIEGLITTKEKPIWKWDLPSTDFIRWADIIQAHDPGSTFFRYPTPKVPGSDRKKSAMTAEDSGNIMKAMLSMIAQGKHNGKFSTGIVAVNENNEVQDIFFQDFKKLEEVMEALKKMAAALDILHVKLRNELSEGY